MNTADQYRFPSSKFFTIALIAIIFLISFRTFSVLNFPAVNSDDAVQILMANDLKLPEDLYYWGQDRLGSLQPLLAHGLIKLLGLPAAHAIAIIQSAFLLCGFLCFSSLFKNTVSKIILAIVWFLPLTSFIDFMRVGQPYGAQFALLGITTVAIEKLRNSKDTFGSLRRHLWISLAAISGVLSLWVSELSIVPLFFISLAALIYYVRGFRSEKIQDGLRLNRIRLEALNVVVIALCGAGFIYYAKQSVPRRSNNLFRSLALSDIFEILQKLGRSIVDTILVRDGNIYLGIHALLAIGLVGYLIYLFCQKPKFSFWFLIAIASATVSFTLVISSYWVYINAVAFRYFIPVYLFSWLAVLLIAEQFSQHRKKLYALMLAIAIFSSFSLPAYTYSLEPPSSKLVELQQFDVLGEAGLIGDYWSAYILCSANPSQLSCTPRQRGGVRCRRCVSKVFDAPTIYLVKNRWLERFPAQIVQFRRHLQKDGQAIEIAGYRLAPYRLIQPPEKPASQ